MKTSLLLRMLLPVLVVSTMGCAAAADFSFTGTFLNDTDVQLFSFTLLNPTAGVSMRTWSYTGGTNAAGSVVPGGGFAPILNLYLADGTQLNPGTGGPCTVPATGNALTDLLPDGVTGECSDVYYPTTLSFPAGIWQPGTYIVALSLNANPGLGDLSAGFFAPNVLGIPVPGNFTCQTGPTGFQGNPPTLPVDGAFCDEFASGVQRNGSWALDILSVDSASGSGVPEPGTGLVMLIGVGVVGLRRRFCN
jgi:hypothetical protein